MMQPITVLALSLAGICVLFSPAAAAAEPAVRPPAVAGSFYPADPAELSRMLDAFLVPEETNFGSEKPSMLVVPHAGYLYSGRVAAAAYRQLRGQQYENVILIGASHHRVFQSAAVWREGSWRTPLGDVAVDAELAGKIAGDHPALQYGAEPHRLEHSLEVQLPFLQKTLAGAFKIIPILLGEHSLESAHILAQAIRKHTAGRNVLIIISTDLSHYHPAADAELMDAAALDLIRKGESRALFHSLESGAVELCGAGAVLTFLKLRELSGGRLDHLGYAHSGTVSGDMTRVVGYGAFALRSAPHPPAESGPAGEKEQGLSQGQQQELLKIARQTIETYLQHGEAPSAAAADPRLREMGAVFVTLRKAGELRGCIGHIQAVEPLDQAVRNNAIAAAAADPRFPPVTALELPELKIEISVLSAPEAVRSPEEIRMGEHGVILKQGLRTGVFLPQVAEETGWDRSTFLAELCSQKAGLPDDCWQDPATRLFIFRSEDFSE